MQKPICDMVHPTHENAMPKSNVRLVRKPVEKLKSQKGMKPTPMQEKTQSASNPTARPRALKPVKALFDGMAAMCFKPHGSTESTETCMK